MAKPGHLAADAIDWQHDRKASSNLVPANGLDRRKNVSLHCLNEQVEARVSLSRGRCLWFDLSDVFAGA